MTATRRYCQRCKGMFPAALFGDHLCQVPADGHTFRLEVSSRMSSRIEPEDGPPSPYTDADWWGEPALVLDVRAWNLPDALRLAATRPLAEWSHDGQLLGEEPADTGTATRDCPRCEGSGAIANSDDGEPWSAWENLPPGSDLAVRAGLVRPIECPECRGRKVVPA